MSAKAIDLLQALAPCDAGLGPVQISDALGDIEESDVAYTRALLRRLQDGGLVQRAITRQGEYSLTPAGLDWLASATEDTPLPATPKGERLALIAERAAALGETKALAAETPAAAVDTIAASGETPAAEPKPEDAMPATGHVMPGSRRQQILQALAQVGDAHPTTDEVLALLGSVGDDERRRLAAQLGNMRLAGLVAGGPDGWRLTKEGRARLSAAPVPGRPPKGAAEPKPRRERAVAVVEHKSATVATVTPPGSVAVTDDGSVLLLEGDRIAARLTAQQAANVAALVQRYSGAA